MREDFAKQLTERERIHHRDHYHNYRNVKGPKGAWNDDEVGGRESMRVRYNHGYDRKSFNENLNPLKGWLRSCVGKKWDKCYSELRKNFDARSVINAHILEHLYDYICVNTKVEDGKVVGLSSRRYTGKGYVPVKELFSDYYVCPKDGTVKIINKPSRKAIEKKRLEEKQRELSKVFRKIDDDTHLHLIDGVWYVFTLADMPKAEVRRVKPHGIDVFKTGYRHLGSPNSRREKTWDELNEQEQARFGVLKVVRGEVLDVLIDTKVYRSPDGSPTYGMRYSRYQDSIGQAPAGRYHVSKATASHKQLKQAGIAK